MIRFATVEDIDAIMHFIDEYWKKNHILARDKEFFLYQHDMYGEITYIISEDDESKVLQGILGYIPYSEKKRDIMLALWKVNHTADPALGIKMLQFLTQNADVRSISCPGIRKKTKGIYEYLGYRTGKMEQWYRLNKKESYTVAVVENDMIPDNRSEIKNQLVLISSFEKLRKLFPFEKYSFENQKPYKSESYIRKRYFEHPSYQYQVYGIEEETGKIDAVVVFRVQECNCSKVLRLVDCIGEYEKIGTITDEIDKLMNMLDVEYTDLYETGLSGSTLEQAGFLRVASSGNIIPNFFAPYEQENIDIWYCSTKQDIVLFKADGDQDRPS